MIDLQQIWVDRPTDFLDCCDLLARHSVLGFDTEFIGEATFHAQLCLLQVAIPDRLFVIDPLAVGPLDQFWQLVTDPSRTVVVHSGREEIRIARQACGRTPTKLFDLQLAAGLTGIGYPVGYAALVQQVLQMPLAKGETLSDWSRRPLTDHQLRYAFDDVRYLLPLHAQLDRQLANLNRQDWLADEVADLVQHAIVDGPEAERWRKLKGTGSLDPRRLAVVRELFHWRDDLAQRQNRPPRAILRDDLVVEIARRNPRSVRDLSVLRGVPSKDHDAIFAAVRRARELPPDQWPIPAERDFEPPTVSLVTNLLLAVLADLCARWSLTPALVASTADVKRFVRAWHDRKPELVAESSLGHGWRSAYIRPVLESVLHGQRALRVADARRTAPLDWDGDGPPPLPGAKSAQCPMP
jgi:ribonuclease D